MRLLRQQPWSIVLVLVGACGGNPKNEPPARSPRATAAADSCRAGELHPCGCVQGKGHRACKDGKLGACVCEHDPKPVEPGAESLPKHPPEHPPANRRLSSLGVPYVFLARGSGSVRPAPSARVTVHYTIWDGSGKKIDDSRARGRPTVFPLRGLIPGFSDVLQAMVVGDRVRAWIPPALGYKNRPGRPQGTLMCDIELLRVW